MFPPINFLRRFKRGKTDIFAFTLKSNEILSQRKRLQLVSIKIGSKDFLLIYDFVHWTKQNSFSS